MKPHAQRFNSVMDIKFPPVDNPHGEVKVYHLSKEEIKKKYGPSPMDILTRELYHKLKAKRLTQQQMAKVVGLPYETVKYIVGHYVRVPLKPETFEKQEFTIEAKSLDGFTPEEYLKLKEKEITDDEIIKHLDTNRRYFSDWKNKHGLIGVRNKNRGRLDLY
jgi:hypothetical protein